ncbi:DcaP family trimeric outer membrane transporter [Shewanella psychrotolerans]|uniref:DcaP family trimeric outer membrane transporter n=1 Tax=Shewanella psychrotolerans TaxID=2864206 RepID=UPI001C657179|nr:DcaP family trimeric outer membrane transporter [Shewanella psychrotolerans]QYK01373.1 porin [Shewanella psychrotolerans]
MNKLKTHMTKIACVCALPMLFAANNASAFDFDVEGTKVSIGGYAKLMLTYDTDGTINAPYNGDLYNAYGTPLDGSKYADSTDLDMTARESRLFVKTSTETEYGTLSSHIEGDFFADIDSDSPTWSNSHGFRIRHAYMKLQNGKNTMLAGQTWTNFMDFASSLPPMDFGSDPGNSFVRQAQVKYQHDFRPGHNISVSLENPTLGMCSAGPVAHLTDCGSETQDKVPDMVVKYFYANQTVTFAPRVLLRRFEIDGQSAFGYALAASGSAKFGDGHKAVLGVMYGDGIGRYAALGFNAGAGLDMNGQIDTLKFKSITGGFSFALTKKIDWTIGAGYSEQDDEGFENGVLTGRANKEAFSWHTNLYWNLTKDLQYAVGVTMGDVEVMDGREGDMTRFQSYIRYSF